MHQRTEQEIMQNWKDHINIPLVSICTITYNHEQYIAEALDSFLMQKTDFSFEILINDDCSTDHTANIIRKYEKKYPNIIKPTYQKENQYSQGIGVMTNFIFPRVKGEYLALCEGDDYWTDKEKLQYQIEKMEEYPACQMSFHPTKLINDQTISDRVLRRHAENDKIFDIKEIIRGDGGFCPTASLIIKKEVFNDIPDFYENAPVGDYFIQIFGSINGGALYIDKTMSAYRIHSGGVWTSMESDFSSRKKFAFEMLHTLEEMDDFFNFQHREEIAFIKSQTFSDILKNKNFSIRDRVDLYKTCEQHLSDNYWTEWLDILSKESEQQQALLDNLKKEVKQTKNSLHTILDKTHQLINTFARTEVIKKYKAYKEVLKTYVKIKKIQK